MSTAAPLERLVLGTNTFGWTAPEQESRAILDRFVALGGVQVDTADEYSEWTEGNPGGVAERIIGGWLRTGDRDRVQVASKVGRHSQRKGLAPDNVRTALAESLERLGTDHVDLYYAHVDDPAVPIEVIARTFDSLVQDGRVRRIGASNFGAERLRRWHDVAATEGLATPAVLQPLYNAVQRETFEPELASAATDLSLEVFTYAGLARGLLTGKYRSEADLRGGARDWQIATLLSDEHVRVVERLRRAADAVGVTTPAAALAWPLTRTAVTRVIASVRSVAQLDELAAFDRPEVLAAVAAATSTDIAA